MKQRQFITLIGGAAVAWPPAARAQQNKNKCALIGGNAGSSRLTLISYTAIQSGPLALDDDDE